MDNVALALVAKNASLAPALLSVLAGHSVLVLKVVDSMPG